MINQDRLVNNFCELSRIDSPSGEESKISEYLSGRLVDLGLFVKFDSYGNVIANDGLADPIMLSAHMDTVEPGRGIRPSVDGNRIVSDGTTILGGDCKAGISVILEALESTREDHVRRLPLEVVFTREEETGLVGARNLDFNMIESREAIVFDGEGPVSRITSSSPTYIGFEIEVTGQSAHAGMEPEKGLSAIRIAAELITRLPQGRLDEETTFNIGRIEGGQVRNAVPETAVLTGEFRSRNLESLDGLRLQITEVIDVVRKSFPNSVIEHHLHTEFETYTLTDDDPATERAKTALLGLGMEPEMRPSGGGTDGNIFRRKGLSAVVVGMAVSGMHTRQEFVTISDLVDASHFCESILTGC